MTNIKFTRQESGIYVVDFNGDRFIIHRFEYIGGASWGIVRVYEDGSRATIAGRRGDHPGYRYLADAKQYVTEMIEAA